MCTKTSTLPDHMLACDSIVSFADFSVFLIKPVNLEYNCKSLFIHRD